MKILSKWISRGSIAFLSLVLIAMMLQVVVDVFMRSFIGAGFPGTADLVGRYYMVALSFMPLALTEIGRRHIEATIFTDGLRGGPRKAVALMGFGISLFVFTLLTYGSSIEALRQTERGAYVEAGTLHFLTWPSYWIPAVAFGLMTLILAVSLVEVLRNRFDLRGHDPLEEIDSKAGDGL